MYGSSTKSSGLESNEELSLAIYPNPTNDQFTIQTNQNKAFYSLVDYSGKILLKGQIDDGSTSVNVSQLPSGLYFMRVDGEQESFVRKVIKN